MLQFAFDGTSAAENITGRHAAGPSNARWRIVVFHDYCCDDCAVLHRSLQTLLQQRNDVTVSIRQLPLCSECNPAFADSDGHELACQAARLAEAAAILHGHHGFEQLSTWLFEQHGRFTEEDVRTLLSTWNWPDDDFLQLSDSDKVRDIVSRDVEYANGRGIDSTPIVFINNVPLRGKTSTARRLQAAFAGLPE